MPLIVWCMLIIQLPCPEDYCSGETAVKGKVISEEQEFYLVDFSEYAKQQRYLGNWEEPKLMNKTNCIKD